LSTDILDPNLSKIRGDWHLTFLRHMVQ
jgi:hypothetical protein